MSKNEMGKIIKFPSKETIKELQAELADCEMALHMIMEQMGELNNDLIEVLERYHAVKEKIECRQRIE